MNKKISSPGVVDWSRKTTPDLLRTWAFLDGQSSTLDQGALNEITSGLLDQITEELARRAARGEVSAFEQPPCPIASDVPGWLKVWPFCLLWKQRPR